MDKPKLFRKKPIVVQVMQYLRADNIFQCQNFCNKLKYDPEHNEYYIETLEGQMTINKNDWIIKGIKGEFYPCKPDIFKETYEEV